MEKDNDVFRPLSEEELKNAKFVFEEKLKEALEISLKEAYSEIEKYKVLQPAIYDLSNLEGPIDEATKKRRSILEKMNKMSNEEFLAAAVRAGVYTKDGNLTEQYQDTHENSSKTQADWFLNAEKGLKTGALAVPSNFNGFKK